ncbi:tetratricopeptide repeat protein [Arenimonas composti]|uniref:Cytochrome C biogenesis protein n=1 Tax=Arenimonas composti TR7-09 = DSM 18010 TaxID=1121013 RepID=A0A091BAT1_9GAMM|nr:hypothetical protein [Arenimonas composti]KFN47924.1 hypothetical protein P873_14400 [Arenimonas composti TR7-09 = DSM 18010]
MTAFVLAAAALLALVLVIVLPSLWRGGRTAGLALVLLLAGGGAGLYALLGTPMALDPALVRAPTTAAEAVAQLEARLKAEPANVEGWVLLARFRAQTGDWVAARDAMANARAVLPDDRDLMVEHADLMMRAAPDGRFPAEATAMLEQVVAAVPTHQRALFYLGAQRYQAGQPAEAVALWERLLPLLDEATAQALLPQLAIARTEAGMPARDYAAELAAGRGGDAAATGTRLAVTIELAPELAARLGDDDVLYVFARAADGAGPPVAARRMPARGFPVQLELSDADALMPTGTLSQQTAVQLAARISKSGDAAAAAGDLVAAAQTVELVAGEAVAATLRIDGVQE